MGQARRNVLSTLIAAPAIGLVSPVLAIDQVVSTSEGLVSADRVGDLLRVVPTFTIVDPKGVPFMVVGEDAKVTGYFFATYGEAKRLLDVAKASADKAIREQKAEVKSGTSQDEEIGPNPWSNARISSVPLDFAVTLASKSSTGAYFRVAPAEEDIDDALVVTGRTELAEGKVPLFYFADFTVVDKDGKEQSPLYFRKPQLLKAWKQANKDVEEPPKVMVTELFFVLTAMLKPGGTDQDLTSLVFVAPEESGKKAKECSKASKEEPFLFGQRLVIL